MVLRAASIEEVETGAATNAYPTSGGGSLLGCLGPTQPGRAPVFSRYA